MKGVKHQKSYRGLNTSILPKDIWEVILKFTDLESTRNISLTDWRRHDRALDAIERRFTFQLSSTIEETERRLPLGTDWLQITNWKISENWQISWLLKRGVVIIGVVFADFYHQFLLPTTKIGRASCRERV